MEKEFAILDSIPSDLSACKSFSDRYFTKTYVLNANGIEGNDLMLMFHSNRITLVCLAPSHTLFKKNVDFKVNYKVGDFDRLKTKVKGKGKKGGPQMNHKTVICKIEFSDGTSVDVPACMQGHLIEVNERLVDNPQLLRDYPDEDGYIGIILTTIDNSEATKNQLMSHDEYLKSLENKTYGQ